MIQRIEVNIVLVLTFYIVESIQCYYYLDYSLNMKFVVRLRKIDELIDDIQTHFKYNNQVFYI